MAGKAKDILGQRFGRLVVVSSEGVKRLSKDRSFAKWRCACDCGSETVALGVSLRDGHTKSCGCLARDMSASTIKATHSSLGHFGGLSIEIRIYKKGAKDRGLDWELTNDQAVSLMTGDCYYCGLPPSTPTRAAQINRVGLRNGIDRADNSLGYTLENSVSCCKLCNRAKGTMGREEFISWAARVTEHRSRSGNINLSAESDAELRWAVQ